MKKYLKTILKVGRRVVAFPFFVLWMILFVMVAGLTFTVDFISGEQIIENEKEEN